MLTRSRRAAIASQNVTQQARSTRRAPVAVAEGQSSSASNSVPIPDLITRLRAHTDESYAKWHANYLRHVTPVLGVRMPLIRKVVHEWAEHHGLGGTDMERTRDIVMQLFYRDFEEEKLAGVLFVHERMLKAGLLQVNDMDWLSQAFEDGGIADWNVCDWLAWKVVRTLVKNGGVDAARDWIKTDGGLWRARCGLVGLLGIVDEEWGRSIIVKEAEVMIVREERWAKTAVGWVMREVGMRDAEAVGEFLEKMMEYVSMECARNAVKKIDKGERNRLLKLVRVNGWGSRREE